MRTMMRLACCLAVCAWLAPDGAAAEMRKRAPLRFSFECGNDNLNEDSGWRTLQPGWSEFHGYLRANSVPYGFTAAAQLVFAFDPAEVFPGNSFPCRVWLEPADDAGITELYSDFGFEFGLEFRNIWVDEVTLGITKDFLLNIQGDGPLPLGDTLLGGMDYVDFLSIPVDELLPGSSQAVQVLQGMLKVADYSNLNIGSISLCGEVVVEGESIMVTVGNSLLTFEQYGEAHAQTVSVYVPPGDYTLQDFIVEPQPVFSFSLYTTVGYALTIVNPVTLTFSPEILQRLGSILPGHYAPPDRDWLHDGPYKKKVDGYGLEADDPWMTLAFPVNQRPDLPDIAVYDMEVNPESGWGKGRAYADEITLIRYSLGNFGERATLPNASWQEYSRTDAQPQQTQWINNRGLIPPYLTLDANASTQLYVYAYFTNPGPHTVSIGSSYFEEKGTDSNGFPFYGLGDANAPNNAGTVSFCVYPRRGTIIGRCMTNPDYPSSGVNDIPVRLSSDAFGVLTTVSAPADGLNGIYRFDGVPTGEVMLEFLPVPPPPDKDGPDYWPMSFHFHHEGGDTDDLRDRGGMCMLQYQTFTGRVCEAASPSKPIPNVRVQLGENRFDDTLTGADGRFGFRRVSPRGAFVLVFDHPLYAPKRILVTLAVCDTDQRHSVLESYYDYDSGQMIGTGRVYLDRDTTRPTVELFAFDASVCTGTLAYAFCGKDDGGARLPSEYRLLALDRAGDLIDASAWLPYAAPTGALDRAEGVWDLSFLGEDAYQLQIVVRDPAGNEAASQPQPFSIDRTPPSPTVAIAGGAATWYQGTAPVTVTLAAPEPAPWRLELSADGAQWSAPLLCTGAAATVREWTLVRERIEAACNVTVHARVTDAAGLSAVATDTVAVDMSGLVRLASGYDYWPTNQVTLDIRIMAPDGARVCNVNSYGGKWTVGSNAATRLLAQEFVLGAATNVSRAKLSGYPQVVGQPRPLHLRLVSALSDANPTGGVALASWAGTAEDVRLSENTYHYTYADLPDTTLPAGRYFLVLYADDVSPSDYYLFNAGNTLYGGNGWHAYTYADGAWQTVSNAPPGIGDPNLQFSLYNRDIGQMRLALDGVCDTEAWQPFVSPFPQQLVSWPSQGMHAVCFEYTNAVSHDKDGAYYDSIVTDWTPPTVRSVSVSHVDADRRLLYLTSDVTDDFSPVDTLLWRIQGCGDGDARPYAPEITLPIEWADSLEARFVDRAGNATGWIPAVPAQDFLPPTVSLTASGGAIYTDQTNIAITLVSYDNRGVEGVRLRERRTGHSYGVFRGGTVETSVTLPLIEIPTGKGEESLFQHLDGEYVFAAQACDTAGHVSVEVAARIVLDRAPPTLSDVSLTGPAGEPVTSTNRMLLRLEARDEISPMQARWRVNGADWSEWSPLRNGRSLIPIEGPVGPLSYAAEAQVRDAVGHTVAGAASLRVNRAPRKPGFVRPGRKDGRAGPTPLLVVTPFSDPDGDARGGIEFVVSTLDGRVLLRSGEMPAVDRWQLPAGLLELNTKHTWRARTRDDYGAWSPWSVEFSLYPMPDADGDGLPDYLESSGTDWRNPDTDGDGIPDGLEDFNLDGRTGAGESSPLLADTDGDGVPDNAEDANLNGERDPGETNPALADTDGDGMGDLQELQSGTDPCDGAAYFHFDAIAATPTADGFVVRWIGRAGRSYRLYRLTSLAPGAPPAELVTNVVAVGGVAPWYATPVEVTIPAELPAAWFRVEVDAE